MRLCLVLSTWESIGNARSKECQNETLQPQDSLKMGMDARCTDHMHSVASQPYYPGAITGGACVSHGTSQGAGMQPPGYPGYAGRPSWGEHLGVAAQPAKANCNTTTRAVQSRNHPRPRLSCHGVRGLIMPSFRLVWLGRYHVRHGLIACRMSPFPPGTRPLRAPPQVPLRMPHTCPRARRRPCSHRPALPVPVEPVCRMAATAASTHQSSTAISSRRWGHRIWNSLHTIDALTPGASRWSANTWLTAIRLASRSSMAACTAANFSGRTMAMISFIVTPFLPGHKTYTTYAHPRFAGWHQNVVSADHAYTDSLPQRLTTTARSNIYREIIEPERSKKC